MAAVVHDIVQIQNNGLMVKTNFNYTIRDLLALICIDSLLDVRQIVYKQEKQWGTHYLNIFKYNNYIH